MKAAVLKALGDPPKVCACMEVRDPSRLARDEVIVEIAAAPVNPADLLMMQGKYPGPTEFPAWCGIEGVGRIVEVGKGINNLVADDVVISLARNNWAQRIKIRAEQAVKVRDDADLMQIAMLKANPATALRMLNDYFQLGEGHWIIQNASNSGVGHCVIALAKERGVQTVNVVRREDAMAGVQESGGDVVILDGEDLAERVAAETDGASIMLGLDAVGGEATLHMADCIDEGGTVVNYGFLSGNPCMIHPERLINRGINLTGFWLVKTLENMNRVMITAMYQELANKVDQGVIHVPIEQTYVLEDVKDAVAHAMREGRSGKILIIPNGPIID